jgi:hypothetical protein
MIHVSISKPPTLFFSFRSKETSICRMMRQSVTADPVHFDRIRPLKKKPVQDPGSDLGLRKSLRLKKFFCGSESEKKSFRIRNTGRIRNPVKISISGKKVRIRLDPITPAPVYKKEIPRRPACCPCRLKNLGAASRYGSGKLLLFIANLIQIHPRRPACCRCRRDRCCGGWPGPRSSGHPH